MVGYVWYFLKMVRVGNSWRVRMNCVFIEYWWLKLGKLNQVFKIKGFIISRLSLNGYKLGSYRNRTGNKMKREVKVKGCNVRIVNIIGELDFGLLVFS